MSLEEPNLAELFAMHRGQRSNKELGEEIGLSEGRIQQISNGFKNYVIDAQYIPAASEALRVSQVAIWQAIGRTKGLTLKGTEEPLVALALRTLDADLLEEEDLDLIDRQLKHLTSLRRTLAGKKGKGSRSDGTVTALRAARRSTGSESRARSK